MRAMRMQGPLAAIFAGLSLLSSISAPEFSYVKTALVLALFGWRFWLFCNAVAWWTVWDFLVSAVSFTRLTLAAAGFGPPAAWALASAVIGGGIALAVLVPSFVFSRYVKRRLLARFPRLAYRVG